MKKWVFWLAVLLFLSYKVVQLKAEVGQDHSHEQNEQAQVQGETMNIPPNQVFQGNLILVNTEYPVHEEGVRNDVVKLAEHAELIQGYGLLDSSIEVSASVAQTFLQMIEAARADGVSHFMINSGYRGVEEQRRLYKEMGPDYAMPAGHSEHNVGLALDIGSTQMKMEKAPEGKWLKENAWKYGFTLRYPEDKSAITGTQYEPWHFRYVGWPHSAIMQEHNFVLEEYLDYLRKEKHITENVDGEPYEISYYPVSESNAIQVPENRHYEISGDNMAGIIVTVYP